MIKNLQRLVLSVICCGVLALSANTVHAGSREYQFDLPAQPLADALRAVGRQTSKNVLFDPAVVEGLAAPALSARLSLSEAMQKLLSGTTLHIRDLPPDTVVVERGKSAQAGEGDAVHLAQTDAASAGADTAATGSSPGVKLEEVIVTAQKREERIKDVPMSITALTGDALSRAGINGSQDLHLSVPGMTFSTLGGIGTVGIRGISSAGLQGLTADQSAAIYLDGLYQPTFEASLFSLMDVKRVEVLKGPQVVLYGRNATAGAVSYISNDPKDQFGGNINVEAGSFSLLRTNAALDVPLIPGKLLARASAMSIKNDGLFDNAFNTSDHPGQTDTWGGRLTLKYLATDKMSITVRGLRLVEKGGVNPFKALDPAAYLGALGIDPATIAANNIKDPWTVTSNQPTSNPTRKTTVSATLDWDLGWGKLTSITGYDKYEVGPRTNDADSTSVQLLASGIPGQPGTGTLQTSKTTSHETYLSGLAGPLDWLAGATWLHEQGAYGGGSLIFGSPFYTPLVSDTKAWAAYSQLGYAITSRFKLSAGVRFSHEKKQAERGGFSNVPSPPLVLIEKSWDATTPTFTATFRPKPDHLLYATVAKGFKSGGFNSFDASPTTPGFDPEHITNYELGMKSSWLAGRAGLDWSVFRYDYTDMQIRHLRATFDSYENAGTARGKGAEVAAHLLPLSGLQIDAGLALLDVEFTKYDTAIDTANGPVAVSLAGNRPAFAPRVTSNFAASYRAAVGALGHATFRMNYYYASRHYLDQFNNPALAQGGYSLVNARITFQPHDSNLEFGMFGKNLTNKLIYTFGYQPFGPGTTVIVPADPRTWGLSLSYDF